MRNKCKMVIICLTVAVCSLNLGCEDANKDNSKNNSDISTKEQMPCFPEIIVK